MTTLVHAIDSFWLCDEDYDLEEGVVLVDVMDKANAGPADTRKIRLPTNGYSAQLLYRVEDGEPEPLLCALLLKPVTVGQTLVIFGAAPVLSQFADNFFPF